MAGNPEVRIRGYKFIDVSDSTHTADVPTYEQAVALTYKWDADKATADSA